MTEELLFKLNELLESEYCFKVELKRSPSDDEYYKFALKDARGLESYSIKLDNSVILEVRAFFEQKGLTIMFDKSHQLFKVYKE